MYAHFCTSFTSCNSAFYFEKTSELLAIVTFFFNFFTLNLYFTVHILWTDCCWLIAPLRNWISIDKWSTYLSIFSILTEGWPTLHLNAWYYQDPCTVLRCSHPLTAFCVVFSCRMKKARAQQTSCPIPSMCPWRWPSRPPRPRSCACCWGRPCPAPAPLCPSRCIPRPRPLSRTRPGRSWPAWGSDWASVWWSQDRRWVELHSHRQVFQSCRLAIIK